jgi:NADH:ubiquinone oxidoreductase subunit 6 (subunit J)
MSTFTIIIINIIFFLIICLIFLFVSTFSSIYALLSLICIAFCIVGLLLLLQMDWFSLLLGIIYLGSIIVLFLFVIMLLKIQYQKINYKKLFINLFIFLFCLSLIYLFFFLDIVKYFLKIYIYINTSSILFYILIAPGNGIKDTTSQPLLYDILLNSKESNLYLLTDLFIYFYTYEGGFIILILLCLLLIILIGITNILTLLKDKNVYINKLNIKINKKIS